MYGFHRFQKYMLINHYYRLQRSCKGYVFTPVCHSVHGGVYLSACWDTPTDQAPPRTRHPLSGPPPWTRHPPGADPPRTRHPPEETPPASRRLLLRTARILLECILVILFHSVSYTCSLNISSLFL